jgi:hypothetical protein
MNLTKSDEDILVSHFVSALQNQAATTWTHRFDIHPMDAHSVLLEINSAGATLLLALTELAGPIRGLLCELPIVNLCGSMP